MYNNIVLIRRRHFKKNQRATPADEDRPGGEVRPVLVVRREIAVQPIDSRWVSWGGSCLGLLGRFTLAGDLAELWPFLVLGAQLQVGKGASYGLGSYQLEPQSA